MAELDVRLWNLFVPMVLAIGCASDPGAVDTGSGGPTDSTDESGGDGDGPENCVQPYNVDPCPFGELCDPNAGTCEPAPPIQACADAPVPNVLTIPVGGAIQLQHSASPATLWIGTQEGDVVRVDDVESGTTTTVSSVPGPVRGLGIGDAVGDDGEDLLVGWLDYEADAHGTHVLESTPGGFAAPAELFDEALDAFFVADLDGDGDDEFLMDIGTGYDAVHAGELEPKPWTLGIPLTGFSRKAHHGDVGLDEGRPTFAFPSECDDGCTAASTDLVRSEQIGGPIVLVGSTRPIPSQGGGITVGLPMADGPSLAFVAGKSEAEGSVLGQLEPGDGTGGPQWPEGVRSLEIERVGAAENVDFNGDGIIDLAMAASDRVDVLLRSSNDLEGCIVTVPITTVSPDMETGDVTGDGVDDVVVTGSKESETFIIVGVSD